MPATAHPLWEVVPEGLAFAVLTLLSFCSRLSPQGSTCGVRSNTGSYVPSLGLWQTCSNWQHWCPLCGVRFIIRTILISFGNIWNSHVNFWILFENVWNSVGKSEYHLEIFENHLDISEIDLKKVKTNSDKILDLQVYYMG